MSGIPTIDIRPQPKQEDALRSSADIVIFGGGAGGGKTWTLLVEPLRHKDVKGFGGVIFRRESPQITNEGGLWDESVNLYPHFAAVPKESTHDWGFPSGVNLGFSHLQHEKTILNWQGSQICYLAFDELTHFTEKQFFYMLSRNRSTCGIKPYVRAGCNPDADSWVAEFIAWWIDQDEFLPTGERNPHFGFAIPERSGVLRYFTRQNGVIRWADRFEDLVEFLPADLPADIKPEDLIKSVTFIPSNVYDNKALLFKDPSYLGNLLSLPLVERERLLGGNWKVRASAGKIFNREWFPIVEALPKIDVVVAYWDFAATEKEIKGNDPDFTARVLIGYSRTEKRWYILEMLAVQQNPAAVEKLFLQTCSLDRETAKSLRARFMVRWEIEPGSAAKRESYRMTTKLAGYDAKGKNFKGDKFARARAMAVQAEARNVILKKGSWNGEFLSHMHGQPDLPHDDIMDAGAGAFNTTITTLSPSSGR